MDETLDDFEPQVDEATIEQNKAINEEYKIWRKNAPMLYDLMYSRALDWPSLTVQWFPDVTRPPDTNMAIHRLLLGTHTSNEQPNYLQIANLSVPENIEPDPQDYDEDRGEIGGYGSREKSQPEVKFNIVQRIDHDGEINKARYMPQNPDIIATMCNDGRAMVFDRTKLPSQPTGTVNPQIELVGHSEEGFALCWNPNVEGQVATGSNDNTVKLWNIKDYTRSNKKLKAERTFSHHSSIVNDVEFSPQLPWALGTVSDDLSLRILDLRTPPKRGEIAFDIQNAHTDAINTISFNPFYDHLLLTGSADKSVAMWDLRYMQHNVNGVKVGYKVWVGEHHKDAVSQVEWHTTNKAMFASAGHDRRIRLWDLERVGMEQIPEDAEDGPPELHFMHGGHTSSIAEFAWNKNDVNVICSSADDNLMQIWRPTKLLMERWRKKPTIAELDGK